MSKSTKPHTNTEIMTIYLSLDMSRISGGFNSQLSARAYIGLKLLFVFLFSNINMHTDVIQYFNKDKTSFFF